MDGDLDALFAAEDEVPHHAPSPQSRRSAVKQRWLVKLPGFMSVQADKLYTRDSLEDDLIEIEDRQLEDASRIEAYVRLATSIRLSADGKSSNCRLLKWSDGSLTMAIGRDQFEVQVQPMRHEQCYLYDQETRDAHDQGEMKVLKGYGRLTERLALRPFIMPDQSHRRYVAVSAQDSDKNTLSGSKIKLAVTLQDPELEKQRMIRAEQEKIKNRRRLEAKQRQALQKTRVRLSANFLEEGLHGDIEQEEEEEEEDEMDEEDEAFIDNDEDGESAGDNDNENDEQEEDDDDGSESESESEAEETDDEDSAAAEKGIKRKRIITDDD